MVENVKAGRHLAICFQSIRGPAASAVSSEAWAIQQETCDHGPRGECDNRGWGTA